MAQIGQIFWQKRTKFNSILVLIWSLMQKIFYELGSLVGACIFLADDHSKRKSRRAFFKCGCGRTFLAAIDKVKSFHTTSCGCEHSKMLANRNSSHGLSRTREYRIWLHMKERCGKAEIKKFKNWAGRGIKVCPRWLLFENFYADMGPRPSTRHSIDRFPNKDGDYEPGNCRWATPMEQSNNTNHNLMLEYRGETKTLMEWSRMLGLSYHTVKARINRQKWSIAKAFETPIKKIKCRK